VKESFMPVDYVVFVGTGEEEELAGPGFSAKVSEPDWMKRDAFLCLRMSEQSWAPTVGF